MAVFPCGFLVGWLYRRRRHRLRVPERAEGEEAGHGREPKYEGRLSARIIGRGFGELLDGLIFQALGVTIDVAGEGPNDAGEQGTFSRKIARGHPHRVGQSACRRSTGTDLFIEQAHHAVGHGGGGIGGGALGSRPSVPGHVGRFREGIVGCLAFSGFLAAWRCARIAGFERLVSHVFDLLQIKQTGQITLSSSYHLT